MRQAQKKKEKDRVAIALVLAFCVIALTSIFTIKSNIDKINGSAGNPVPVYDQTDTSKLKNKSSSNADDTAADKTDASEASIKVPVVDSKASPKTGSSKSDRSAAFGSPVKDSNATVSNKYAMDSLIYSVTLDQYMTHCGTDIEAPEDAQVLAVAAGTVTAVYQDDRYGKSIELTHDNGFVTIYSNLSTNEMVEVGDIIEAGKIIGGVGSTGLFESMEPAHLHLEMLKDGAYVDPMKYISLK